MTLAESLLRIRGRQLLASGLRLAYAGAYLLAVVAVLASGQGSPAVYAILVTGGNALCAALMLMGLRRRSPATTSPRFDGALARTFLREGWVYSTSQSLLALLFGFDVILLMQASGPAAVAVYALYIGSCRRVIGVLFTDSLASVLIALLARAKASTGGQAVLRYAPRLLALGGTGTALLVVVSLAAADALHHLVAGWVALAAIGCTAHALVVVLFCIFTVQPALGLARARTALTAAFLPGLALQGVAAAVGGAPGVMAAFAVLNVALAGWFLLVVRRSTADLSRFVDTKEGIR
jgi:O-antigen/teichoic acid export membrane protein